MPTASPYQKQILRGEALFEEGDYEGALAAFDAVLADAPTNAAALNDAGLTAEKLGRIPEAAAYFERALEAQPKNANALFGLVDLLVREEEADLAREAFTAYAGALAESAEKQRYAAALFGIEALDLRALSAEELCAPGTLDALRHAWGNTGWSAGLDYLEAVARHAAEAKRPILECGSGLTTLLLGLLTQGRGVAVWSLEHHPTWHARVQDTLDAFGLDHVTLCHAPLKEHAPSPEDAGGYAWYDAPHAQMPTDFGLVVCDGPPGTTPGGRYGLLPVMHDHLAPDAVLLADDAARPAEAAILQRWQREASADVELCRAADRAYAVVRLGGAPAPGGDGIASTGDGMAPSGDEMTPSGDEVIPSGDGVAARAAPVIHAPDASSASAASSAPAAPPIFIGGAGRSGTTLVRSILNAHPRIAIGAELKVTPAIAQCWQTVRQHEAYLGEEFDLAPADVDAAFGQLVATLLETHRRRSGKPRVGEKTPNNVFAFPALHRMFPGSPLVHVVRDGRDVVRSLLEKDWTTPDGQPMAITRDPAAAAAYWRRAVMAGLAAAEDPSLAGRYHEMRYETLVHDPEAAVRKLLAFVGEPWDPAVLHFHQQETATYTFTQRPITARSVGRWQDVLDRSVKDVVKDVAGDLLLHLGYADDLDW